MQQRPSVSPTPSPVTQEIPAPSSLRVEDLYDYRRCTIVLVVQLRPQDEPDQPRQILASVQNGSGNTADLPLYRLLSEDQLGGSFPPALVDLLGELERQLPERQQRHAQRAAASPQTPAPVSQKQATASSRQSGTVPKPVPPTPTMTPHKPAERSTFGGIFDGL